MGPMQWTPGGLVPAISAQSTGGIVGARVPFAEGDEDDNSDDRAPSRAAMPRKPTPKSITPKNVVGLARARLRAVKTELRRMKRLEKERDELERLVDAAENKPRAVVREIKRSAG